MTGVKLWLLVAAGGAANSLMRWLLARALDRWLAAALVPAGILTVNGLGCLLMGVVLGATSRGTPVAGESARLLLATGVCGGFTTFSSFSYQTLALAQQGGTSAALLYLGLSVGLGLAATAIGLGLARWAA